MSDIPINLLINSKNLEKNDLGSVVQVSLPQSLDIQGKKCRLIKSSIWYNFPNISPLFDNNKIEFSYNNTLHLFTFDKGLYSLDSLNETLSEKLGDITLDINLFSFNGDSATGKVTIFVKTNIVFSIDLSSNNNKLMRDLLGFKQGGIITTSINLYEDGSEIAQLNSVDSININLSFTGGNSCYFNGIDGSSIIQNIPLNTSPGNLIIYEPFHPQVSACIGSNISFFTISLYDQTNTKLLDMNGESFSLHIELYD